MLIVRLSLGRREGVSCSNSGNIPQLNLIRSSWRSKQSSGQEMNTQSETVRQLVSQTVRQSDCQTVRQSDSQESQLWNCETVIPGHSCLPTTITTDYGNSINWVTSAYTDHIALNIYSTNRSILHIPVTNQDQVTGFRKWLYSQG